jgi:hypothetical protein
LLKISVFLLSPSLDTLFFSVSQFEVLTELAAAMSDKTYHHHRRETIRSEVHLPFSRQWPPLQRMVKKSHRTSSKVGCHGFFCRVGEQYDGIFIKFSPVLVFLGSFEREISPIEQQAEW